MPIGNQQICVQSALDLLTQSDEQIYRLLVIPQDEFKYWLIG